jgi:hypothetical protein
MAGRIAQVDISKFIKKYHPPLRAKRLRGLANTALQKKVKQDSLNYMIPQNRHIYQRLNTDQFRILVLLPASSQDDTIRCHLVKAEFAKTSSYEALSYVWGTEPPFHEIEVNDLKFSIRPNLFYVLRRLRSSIKPLALWVDSICINQEDDKEKNEQITKMAQIYQNACSVCIWLGEEDPLATIAIDFIPKLLDTTFFLNPEWRNDYGFHALAKLLDRAWFCRGWVLQEAAFAQNSILLCGSREVHLDDFIDAVNLSKARLSELEGVHRPSLVSQYSIDLLINLRDSPGVRLLDAIREVFLKSDGGKVLRYKASLETLVELGAFWETTDPKDAIYALLRGYVLEIVYVSAIHHINTKSS